MEFITDESLKQKMIDKGKYIDASLVKLNIPANIVALVDKNIAQNIRFFPLITMKNIKLYILFVMKMHCLSKMKLKIFFLQG